MFGEKEDEEEEEEKEEEKEKEKDVMTSKNLTTVTWQVGNPLQVDPNAPIELYSGTQL